MSQIIRPERQTAYRVDDLFTRPLEESAVGFRWSWREKNRYIEQEPLGEIARLRQSENADA